MLNRNIPPSATGMRAFSRKRKAARIMEKHYPSTSNRTIRNWDYRVKFCQKPPMPCQDHQAPEQLPEPPVSWPALASGSQHCPLHVRTRVTPLSSVLTPPAAPDVMVLGRDRRSSRTVPRAQSRAPSSARSTALPSTAGPREATAACSPPRMQMQTLRKGKVQSTEFIYHLRSVPAMQQIFTQH